MKLTYRQLLNFLKILEADESPSLDLDITVKDDHTGEFHSVAVIMVTYESDTLDCSSDADHPYLLVNVVDDDEDTEGCDDEEPTYESELNRTPWTAYKSPNRW